MRRLCSTANQYRQKTRGSFQRLQNSKATLSCVADISLHRRCITEPYPVEIAVIGTRKLSGEISEAYRKVKPRKPVGKNKENMKMKAPATATAALLFVCDDAPAIMAIQQPGKHQNWTLIRVLKLWPLPIPMAEKHINFRRPNRSTVRTPIGEQTVCQVKTAAPKILASRPERPKYC